MNELKPCPFCGSTNTVVRDWVNNIYETCFFVECWDCGCTLGFMVDPAGWVAAAYETDEKAIAEWNTRADAAQDAVPMTEENMAEHGWVRERTCRNKIIEINKNTPPEWRTDNFSCSECGAMFFADSEHVNYPIDWAYCPNCGARVVDE